MSKRWTKVEIAFLEKHAGDKSITELAKRFKTDRGTVEKKLKELQQGTAPAHRSGEAVDHFESGLEALYKGDWGKAEKLFDEAVKEGYHDLASRARQFAAVARSRAAAAEAEDPYVRAVYEKNRGDYDAALALSTAQKRAETDGRFAYLAAVVCTLRGEKDAARQHLERAVELDPRNRAHALHDPDLRTLDDDDQPDADAEPAG